MNNRVFPIIRHVFIVIVLLLATGSSGGQPAGEVKAGRNDDLSVSVYFSPRGGCTEAIVSSIAAARREILVQAYSFTSAPIARALVDAHKRGITVKVVLDRSQRKERYSSADFTAHAGILTFIDDAHAIAHNKVMIIDRKVVITGSFNFTKAAEQRNAENLLIITSVKLAEAYRKNWENHREHSDLYAGR